jgi:NTE family protein
MKRKKLGLALGSGGTRGYVHIGVIEALIKNNIPIDFIAGASAGAVIGGMYAATNDIKYVRDVWEKLDFRTVVKMFNDPVLYSGGFIGGNKVIEHLRELVGAVDIKDLKIPFRAISTDMQNGESYEHSEGDLAIAIRCSSSIPVIFKPYKMKGRLLVDGGASQPVPAQTVRNMGADVVVAVNLDSAFFNQTKKKFIFGPSTIDSLLAAIELLRFHLAKETSSKADLIINNSIPSEVLNNIKIASEVIEHGYKVTEKAIPKIKKLLEN